jgi:hypothetical protein
LRLLLDPNANHYQGDLFSRLFLAECSVKDFFSDLSNCLVQCDYENIDIYQLIKQSHQTKVYVVK